MRGRVWRRSGPGLHAGGGRRGVWDDARQRLQRAARLPHHRPQPRPRPEAPGGRHQQERAERGHRDGGLHHQGGAAPSRWVRDIRHVRQLSHVSTVTCHVCQLSRVCHVSVTGHEAPNQSVRVNCHVLFICHMPLIRDSSHVSRDCHLKAQSLWFRAPDSDTRADKGHLCPIETFIVHPSLVNTNRKYCNINTTNFSQLSSLFSIKLRGNFLRLISLHFDFLWMM